MTMMTKSLCTMLLISCSAEPPAPPLLTDCVAIDDNAVIDPRAAVIDNNDWQQQLEGQTSSPTRDGTLLGDIRVWMDATPASRLSQVAAVAADDEPLLRAGLQRFDACTKRHPPTLLSFYESIFDFSTEAGDELLSSPKAARRRIVRSAEFGVFAAMTLGEDDTIQEVEVLLTDRRDDGEIEFIAYDADGRLRTSSPFPTADGGVAQLPVPFSCMGCHRAPGRGFVEVHPSPTGIPAPL
jgi:hypothetical protein